MAAQVRPWLVRETLKSIKLRSRLFDVELDLVRRARAEDRARHPARERHLVAALDPHLLFRVDAQVRLIHQHLVHARRKRAIDVRLVQALILYGNPDQWPDAREALELAGREDLIGREPTCLVPAESPVNETDCSARADSGRPRDADRSAGRSIALCASFSAAPFGLAVDVVDNCGFDGPQ